MKPYFDTNHLAGLLLLIVVLAWGAMELGEFPGAGEHGREPPGSTEPTGGSSPSPSPSPRTSCFMPPRTSSRRLRWSPATPRLPSAW